MKLEPLFEPDEGLDLRIRELEQMIGVAFPDDYVQFLRRMNGAALDDDESEDFSIELKNHNHTDISVLYGSGEHIYGAARLEAWLHKRPHPKSIVVGHDSGGNNFWISLRPVDYGTVHFRHEDVASSNSQIAQNWTEFLSL